MNGKGNIKVGLTSNDNILFVFGSYRAYSHSKQLAEEINEFMAKTNLFLRVNMLAWVIAQGLIVILNMKRIKCLEFSIKSGNIKQTSQQTIGDNNFIERVYF